MSALIEFEDVCKYYRMGDTTVKAADHISMKIEKGEFVAVVGQSGSGKSTMMNVLGCLDIPTRGTYRLDGVDVRELSDKELSRIRNKQIGFIFQQYNLIQNLTVLENVELPLIYRGVPKKERHELSVAALKKVGLAHRMDHRPSEMSGGQQQRTSIGRALVKNPDILLCDEPTGALDYKTSKEILKLIEDVNKKYGNTIIMVTHNDAIKNMADRVIKLRDGAVRHNDVNEHKVSAEDLDW